MKQLSAKIAANHAFQGVLVRYAAGKTDAASVACMALGAIGLETARAAFADLLVAYVAERNAVHECAITPAGKFGHPDDEAAVALMDDVIARARAALAQIGGAP